LLLSPNARATRQDLTRTPTSWRSRWWLLATASYAAIATVILWPVLQLGVRTSSVLPQEDTSIYVWTNGWVAHAVRHLENPFYSTTLFHPAGMNLVSNNDAWTLAFVFTPVTWLFGALASMNIELWLGLVISAVSMAICAGRLTSSPWARWAAGLVWGFSPFAIRAVSYGWVNLVWLVYPPLVFYVGWRLLVDRNLSPRRAGVVLSVATVAQLLLSGEILAITAVSAVFTAVALGLYALRLDRAVLRDGVNVLARTALWSLPGIVILGTIPLYYLLVGPQRLASWVYPRSVEQTNSYPLARLVSGAVIYLGSPVGRLSVLEDAYFGVVFLLALLMIVVVLRRRRLVWLLAAWAVLGVWCTSTTHLPVNFFELFWQLPFLRNITPYRFIVLTWFAAGLLVALGVRAIESYWTTKRSLSLALSALIVVGAGQLGVAIAGSLPVVAVTNSPDAAVAALVRQHRTVILTFPSPRSSRSMIQQTQEGFGFSLPGGYGPQLAHAGPITQGGFDVLAALSTYFLIPPSSPTSHELDALERAVTAWRVTAVVAPITRCIGTGCISGDPTYFIAASTELWGLPTVTRGEWVWSPRSNGHGPVTAAQWSACTRFREPPHRVPACIYESL